LKKDCLLKSAKIRNKYAKKLHISTQKFIIFLPVMFASYDCYDK